MTDCGAHGNRCRAVEPATANMGKFKRLLDIVHWRPERPVDLAVAAMVVLATLLLGASYHAPLAVWCSLLLVASSIYLNDVTGWLRLDRRGPVGCRWPPWWFGASKPGVLDGDWQLAAISYVLLILQIILLFQAKTDRIVWQVMLLSVGQVAVAAGLSPGLWFGPLLVLYMLVGLAALAHVGHGSAAGRRRRDRSRCSDPARPSQSAHRAAGRAAARRRRCAAAAICGRAGRLVAAAVARGAWPGRSSA